jgi:hypothetical protein
MSSGRRFSGTKGTGAGSGNARARSGDASSRSGSETRKREPIIGFRATQAERAKIEASARRAGLTVGSYVRSRALKAPETRSVRRPAVETAELARLLGMLGIIGGTIAQIAKEYSAHPEDPLAVELHQAVADFRHAAEAIILAMGKHPHLLHVTHHDH